MANYTYTPGQATALNDLRTLIPDHVIRKYNPPAAFSDEELQRIYDLRSDLYLALADICDIIASSTAKQAILINLGSVSIDKSRVPQYFLTRARQLREMNASSSGSGPVEFIDSFSYSVDEFGNDRSKYIGNTEDE